MENEEKTSDKHFKNKGHLYDENYYKGNYWLLCLHVKVWEGGDQLLMVCELAAVWQSLTSAVLKRVKWFSQNMFIYNPCKKVENSAWN